MLDLQSVRLFVLAADLGNFSRAAEAAGTVQPVVSQRIRALEDALGRKLLDRTPRYVRLTPDGRAFLAPARHLLAAHDGAARFADAPAIRFALGVSDHTVGTGLSAIVKAVRASLPAHAVFEARVGLSLELRALFEAGELDAAVIRRETGGRDGELIGRDPLGWRGMVADAPSRDVPVPLAMLAPPCGVRAVAIRELERVSRPWRETFVGGGCAALVAAVQAGLGVAPMGQVASGGLADVGDLLGLPPLPASEIVLFARATSPDTARAIDAVTRCLRSRLPPASGNGRRPKG